MRLLCSLTAVFLGISSIAHADSISGTFVGKSESGVSLVQLVESRGGQLTGRYQDFALLPDGKTIGVNASLTGVRDGEVVVVTIKPTQFLSSNITASGTWRGRVLHLTGGSNGNNNIVLNLIRSDEADFRANVATLTRRAEQIGELRTRKEIVARIVELTKQMNAFTKSADDTLGGFAPTEERYKLITRTMKRALARARLIYGDGQAAVARNQIYVEINQAAIEAEQINISVEMASRRFGTNVTPLVRGYHSLNQRCPANSTVTTVSSDQEELFTACQTMTESAKRFQRTVATMRSALSQIEATWRIEHQKQEKIARAADASD
jgi:hypothetical protein